MSASRKTIVLSGTPTYNGNVGARPVGAEAGYFSLYEKTTNDSETTVGRIAKRGTAGRQVKLWTTGVRAVGVFDWNAYYQGRDSSDLVDSEMSYDGKGVSVIIGGDFAYEAEIISTNTIVYGDPLEPETATGKLRKYTNVGPIVAIAEADGTFVDASTHHRLRVRNVIGIQPQKIWTTETLVSADAVGAVAGKIVTLVGTLSYSPEYIEYVEATHGATVTGAIGLISSGTVQTSEAKISGATRTTLTFAAIGGVTGAVVRYLYAV